VLPGFGFPTVQSLTRRFIGTRGTASAKRTEDQAPPIQGTVKHKTSKSRFVVCVRDRGVAASLELRKVYRVIPGSIAEKSLVRLVDESGEYYLFPETCLMSIDLPAPVARAIVAAD
jgi:hypothetical protein